MIKDIFPKAFLDLAKEVTHHPQLKLNPAEDFYLNLARIAAYCEVILDGVYTPEDQIAIAERLTEKLYKSRRSM